MDLIQGQNSTITCPKCGTVQPVKQQCQQCGIYFHKIRQQTERAIKRTRLSVSSRSRHTEKINVIDTAVQFLRSLARSGVIKTAVFFVLIPFFGGSIIFTTLFFQRERHVLYEYNDLVRFCGNLADSIGEGKTVSRQVRQWGRDFIVEYSKPEIYKPFVREHGDNVCSVKYSITIGNIGKQSIESISIKFDDMAQQKLFLDGTTTYHVDFDSQKIRATSKSNHPPRYQILGDGAFNIINLQPNRIVRVNFESWFPGDTQPASWEELDIAIDIENTVVQQGNPSATALGRLLTFFL